MSARKFVYDTLRLYPGISDLVGDRVMAQSSLLTGNPAQLPKPFCVYHIGNSTDEGMEDPDGFSPNRQFIQVYFYDLVGDYTRIDDLVKASKTALQTATLSGDICGVNYLETSRDLDDPTLEAIMRYVRFQLAMAR